MESNLKAVIKDKYIYLDILDIKFYYGLSGHKISYMAQHFTNCSFKDKNFTRFHIQS